MHQVDISRRFHLMGAGGFISKRAATKTVVQSDIVSPKQEFKSQRGSFHGL